MLIRDTRGLAMVEGALVLPVMVAILLGLFAMHDHYGAALGSADAARACAWKIANRGCAGEIPSGCEMHAVRRHDTALDLASGESDQLLGVLEREAADEPSLGGGGALSSLSTLLSGLIGVGSGVDVSAERKAWRPELYGGGTVTVKSRYRTLCNEQEVTVTDVFVGMYCAFTDGGPGC